VYSWEKNGDVVKGPEVRTLREGLLLSGGYGGRRLGLGVKLSNGSLKILRGNQRANKSQVKKKKPRTSGRGEVCECGRSKAEGITGCSKKDKEGLASVFANKKGARKETISHAQRGPFFLFVTGVKNGEGLHGQKKGKTVDRTENQEKRKEGTTPMDKKERSR